MTLRHDAFSRQHRTQDVYAFVLWRYVAVQIWRVKELLVPGIVASTIKEKHAHNVLFNVTGTPWRRGNRCALLCDVIVTNVNEQKGVPDSLYQTATRGTRQKK